MHVHLTKEHQEFNARVDAFVKKEAKMIGIKLGVVVLFILAVLSLKRMLLA